MEGEGAWSEGAWSEGAWSEGAWSEGAWSEGAWSEGRTCSLLFLYLSVLSKIGHVYMFLEE